MPAPSDKQDRGLVPPAKRSSGRVMFRFYAIYPGGNVMHGQLDFNEIRHFRRLDRYRFDYVDRREDANLYSAGLVYKF